MRPLRLVPFVVVVAVLAACATTGTAGSAGGDSTTDPANSAQAGVDQSRITSDEIARANLPTAYDLVERLRRPWLRRQGALGGEVVVYMDAQRIGGAEKLREIPSVEVSELQYLTNELAVRRWGNQITGAVITVVRRR